MHSAAHAITTVFFLVVRQSEGVEDLALSFIKAGPALGHRLVSGGAGVSLSGEQYKTIQHPPFVFALLHHKLHHTSTHFGHTQARLRALHSLPTQLHAATLTIIDSTTPISSVRTE